MDSADLTVLIPTVDRPEALAVTLSGLAAAQIVPGMRVVVSDQSSGGPVFDHPAVCAALRILDYRGAEVATHVHLPRRGLAEHRSFLLDQATTPYVLFLDDDVWLEPGALRLLTAAMDTLACGFVGMAVQGLSYRDDVRPHQQVAYEEWDGGVRPERVRRGERAWGRASLHSAANLMHIAGRRRLRRGEWRAYKVAWLGGCVLYDRRKLVRAGGFDFWPAVAPEHAGEDVVAELNVMERYGGAGILPSMAFHLELPTTVPNRQVECYDVVFGGARR